MRVIETSLTFKNQLSQRTSTDYIVLHHAEANKCTVEDIHRWHLQRGWSGIGYHYLVRKDGSIYRGRPQEAVGAHCPGYNSCSVGVCAEGNYEQENMPTEQQSAILWLVRQLKQIYPHAKIVGHRDLYATKCPGKNFPLSFIQEALTMGTIFKDVPDDHWAINDIKILKEKGIMRGDQDGNFGLGRTVTREELAAVIARLLRLLEVQ